MALVLLDDQYGSRGIAGDLLRNLAEENLPEDGLPRRPEYHEIEIFAGPGDTARDGLALNQQPLYFQFGVDALQRLADPMVRLRTVRRSRLWIHDHTRRERHAERRRPGR